MQFPLQTRSLQVQWPKQAYCDRPRRKNLSSVKKAGVIFECRSDDHEISAGVVRYFDAVEIFDSAANDKRNIDVSRHFPDDFRRNRMRRATSRFEVNQLMSH